MKTPRLYTSLILNGPGDWRRSEMPTTLKEARRLEKFNRCLGGIQTQIVPATNGEIALWKEENE